MWYYMPMIRDRFSSFVEDHMIVISVVAATLVLALLFTSFLVFGGTAYTAPDLQTDPGTSEYMAEETYACHQKQITEQLAEKPLDTQVQTINGQISQLVASLTKESDLGKTLNWDQIMVRGSGSQQVEYQSLLVQYNALEGQIQALQAKYSCQ